MAKLSATAFVAHLAERCAGTHGQGFDSQLETIEWHLS